LQDLFETETMKNRNLGKQETFCECLYNIIHK
jgi:hypothetical protein